MRFMWWMLKNLALFQKIICLFIFVWRITDEVLELRDELGREYFHLLHRGVVHRQVREWLRIRIMRGNQIIAIILEVIFIVVRDLHHCSRLE